MSNTKNTTYSPARGPEQVLGIARVGKLVKVNGRVGGDVGAGVCKCVLGRVGSVNALGNGCTPLVGFEIIVFTHW